MTPRIVEIAPPGPAADPLRDWPADLREEFASNQHNGAVGNVLVSETDLMRVWHLHLPPGGWLTFHRHVLDYFWSATRPGIARGFYNDGRIVDAYHHAGETRHYRHGPGEYFVHGIRNVGDTDLEFVTVEFLQGDNPPIEVDDRYRLSQHMAPALETSE